MGLTAIPNTPYLPQGEGVDGDNSTWIIVRPQLGNVRAGSVIKRQCRTVQRRHHRPRAEIDEGGSGFPFE